MVPCMSFPPRSSSPAHGKTAVLKFALMTYGFARALSAQFNLHVLLSIIAVSFIAFVTNSFVRLHMAERQVEHLDDLLEHLHEHLVVKFAPR
jgi:hypothetical protein